ncbi:amidohydrolase family protein [Oscillatoria amoena NRMC-F 0135]|nr:amidohydrolase family protein [Oscillatoria amoena NRMC-F 0135]
MKRTLLIGTCILLVAVSLIAQETFPRNDVKDPRAGLFAFTNATVVVDPQTTIQNATLLVKNGRVEQVGTNISVPRGYTAYDLKGKYIYPSLIDLSTNYGLPEVQRPRGGGGGFTGAEQIESNTKGAYNANQAIRSHYNASDEFSVNTTKADELRKAGFGAVLTYKPDGLARGTAAFVTLGESSDNTVLIRSKAAATYSLEKGTSTQNYPTSLMGCIAVLRQTYLDAEWFGSQSPRPFADHSLEAWIQNQKLPQVFDANGWMNVLRADKVGDEFGMQYIIRGSGDEYKRIKEIKATNASLIVPVNYPEAYEVEDPFDAARVSLAEMKHWELAPTNLGALEKGGINFSITGAGLKKPSDLIPNVRKAIENGLSETAALKALTTTPAQLMKTDDQVGSLKKGMIANFLVTSGKLFDEKTIIHQNWVQGQLFSIKPLDTRDFSGTYNLSLNNASYNLEVSGEPGAHKAKIKVNDSTSVDATATFGNDLVTLSFKPDVKAQGSIRLTGWTQDNGWKGKGQLVDGTWANWAATRTGDVKPGGPQRQGGGDSKNEEPGKVIYPFIGHGYSSLPMAETILIKNATVWTNEADGILQNADVLVKDGKIARVGKKPVGTRCKSC